MFERFTAAARDAVLDAQQQAAQLRHTEIGAEHLLLAVLDQDTAGSRVLHSLGVDRAAVAVRVPAREVLDAQALQTLGIDMDEVRGRIEAAFGTGSLGTEPTRGRWFRRSAGLRHIPFTRAAKKALEGTLREAIALGQRHIGTEHLVLGLLADPDGIARQILAGTGVNPDQQVVRTAVLREQDRAA
jgi:ATP-dependent Clp protease ATP-binding subunit ClpA